MDLIYAKEHWGKDEKNPLKSKSLLFLFYIEKLIEIVRKKLQF